MAQLKKISELQKATGVSRNTAIKWVREGIVAGKKIGDSYFVDADALAELIDTSH